MSRRFLAIFLVLSSTVAVSLLPRVASGQASPPSWNTDRGTSEREWSSNRKPPAETITFNWTPELDPQTTLYFLRARCDLDSETASFTAPDVSADTLLRFQLQVSDPRGASDIASVSVTVSAPSAPGGGETGGGGGGGGGATSLWLLLLVAIATLRRRACVS